MDTSHEQDGPAFEHMRISLLKWAPRVYKSIPYALLVGLALMTGIWLWASFGSGPFDHQLASDIGEYFSGTLGTVIGAIGSFLLVLTLYVQIMEYRLTREEMTKGVEAQNAMVEAQNNQLSVLKEQNLEVRSERNLSMVTNELALLKSETADLRDRSVCSEPGLMLLPQLHHQLKNQWAPAFQGVGSLDGTEVASVLTRNLMAIHLLVERARYLHVQIMKLPMSEPFRQIRSRELLFFVKTNYIPYKMYLRSIEQIIRELELIGTGDKALKDQLMTMCQDAYMSLRILDKEELVQLNDDFTNDLPLPPVVRTAGSGGQ